MLCYTLFEIEKFGHATILLVMAPSAFNILKMFYSTISLLSTTQLATLHFIQVQFRTMSNCNIPSHYAFSTDVSFQFRSLSSHPEFDPNF